MLHYLPVALERVRGFRDIYPEDSEPRKRIFEVSEKAAEVFGFRKIEMPSVEHMDLYRIKSGDELVSQCFTFQDKGGRQITLTPEATPTVVRMMTARKDISRPVRWYSFQKYWRYEEPQAGRQREFYQFNGDIFGPSFLDPVTLHNHYICKGASYIDRNCLLLHIVTTHSSSGSLSKRSAFSL